MAALGSADDLLLIAGKGHETGQTIKGVTHHFDDAEVARELAAREGAQVSALWTSDEVARALSPIAMSAPFEANGVTFDSRAVADGDIFFALAGETTDGHAFVADALSRGAAAAVVSRE